jgi:hypothetical protein
MSRLTQPVFPTGRHDGGGGTMRAAPIGGRIYLSWMMPTNLPSPLPVWHPSFWVRPFTALQPVMPQKERGDNHHAASSRDSDKRCVVVPRFQVEERESEVHGPRISLEARSICGLALPMQGLFSLRFRGCAMPPGRKATCSGFR